MCTGSRAGRSQRSGRGDSQKRKTKDGYYGEEKRIADWFEQNAPDEFREAFSYERFVEIVLKCISNGKRAHPTARDYQWLNSQLSPTIALRIKRLYEAAGPMKTGKRIARSAVRRIREKLKHSGYGE